MAELLDDYATAADGFEAVLERAGGDAADLGGASPCAGWTGADVVDHLVAGHARLIAGLGGEDPSPDGGPLTRVRAVRAALVEAAGQPGAMERVFPGPLGGELPAPVMLGIVASDVLLHTWDLARSFGEDVELDPELLRRSWENLLPMDDMIRGEGIFGPKVPVADDAPLQVAALAFFGRRA